tara:strand:- start:1038 stop:1574 length:537 start_codon:yes stop_codon:yes gene_type:complete
MNIEIERTLSRPNLLSELEAELYPLKNDILSILKFSDACVIPPGSGLEAKNLSLMKYLLSEGRRVNTKELAVLNSWSGYMGFSEGADSLEWLDIRELAVSELNVSSQLRLYRAYCIQKAEIIRAHINIPWGENPRYLYISDRLCWDRNRLSGVESRDSRRNFEKIIQKIPDFNFIYAA